MKRLALALGLLLLPACAPAGLGPGLLGPTLVDYLRGLEPKRYLAAAIDAIQESSYYSDRFNWTEIRREAFGQTSGAHVPSDTYPAIKAVIARLNKVDNHSEFSPPGALTQALLGIRTHSPGLGMAAFVDTGIVILVWPNGAAERAGIRLGDIVESVDGTKLAELPSGQCGGVCGFLGDKASHVVVRHPGLPSTALDLHPTDISINVDPSGRRLDQFGYVNVTGFIGLNPFDDAYASRLAGLIAQGDRPAACGWVIDLRQDSGGSVGPMADGLAALLGSDPYAYIVSRQSRYPFTAQAASYKLSRPNAPVAILTSGLTASSGELIAIGFRGRSGWRTFGEPTGGASSSTQLKLLADSALLVVMNALDADRSGRVYGGPLEADVRVPIDSSRYGTVDDPVVAAAMGWLRSQSMCS